VLVKNIKLSRLLLVYPHKVTRFFCILNYYLVFFSNFFSFYLCVEFDFLFSHWRFFLAWRWMAYFLNFIQIYSQSAAECAVGCLGYGLWVMGYGLFRVMGYGLWVVWVMGYGFWVMGYGLWVVGDG
jgi:hypothetical protein